MTHWIEWTEGGQPQRARWRSEAGLPPPSKVEVVDDALDAGTALRMARDGPGLLYRGDFQNARQLLSAMARRIDSRAAREKTPPVIDAQAFHRHRMQQAQRARTLGMLLIPFEADHYIPLRRAPDVGPACSHAWGPATEPYVTSLRELQGAVGAHEWRKKGVDVPALEGKVHPHYGVFAPIRSEYVDLVATAPLASPPPALAFDIGTGTGVLAAVLARRGVARVIATETDPRALASARENVARLQLDRIIDVHERDLFPDATVGLADLIVCNPPWLPGKATSTMERAIYDQDSRMLRGFLDGAGARLSGDGEAWLVLSDLAELLGLRTRDTLLQWIDAGGLAIHDRIDTHPTHPRAADRSDPFHAARSRETTSLWRLKKK
jgi:methylase of polypeptide subunit release factors